MLWNDNDFLYYRPALQFSTVTKVASKYRDAGLHQSWKLLNFLTIRSVNNCSADTL